MKQKDIEKMRETLMKSMDVNLGDIKKLLEKQKIMEEQERMRKIQVKGLLGILERIVQQEVKK